MNRTIALSLSAIVLAFAMAFAVSIQFAHADTVAQIVTFTQTDVVYGNSPTLSASVDSATTTAPYFTSDTPAVCTVSGSTLTTVTVGVCTITAHADAWTDGVDDYTAGTTPATFNITAKPVTVSGITVTSKVYDGTAGATINVSGATFNTLVGSDVVTLDASGVSAPVYNNKNIGTGKAVTYTGSYALAGANAGNYTLSQPSLTGDITAVHLTGNFTVAATKAYDASTTVSVTGRTLNPGVVGSEDVTLSGGTATYNTKNVGTGKTVTLVGATLAGADAGNYVLDSVNTTTADITAVHLVGSFTVTGGTKVYDGTTAASVATRSPGASVVSGDTVTLTGGTATFATRNIGTVIVVTLASASLGGADAGNYILDSVNTTTADITARPITVTAQSDTKTYDGTTSSSVSPSVPSLQTGDTVGTAPTQTFDTKNIGTGKTLAATGLVISDGNGGANYNISYATNGAGVINAKNLTISGTTASNKPYDSATTATASFGSATLNGVVNPDVVTINSSGYAANFNTKNIGTGKAVTITGVILGGADAGNYTVSQPAGVTADITAIHLTGAFTTAMSRVYDGGSVASVATRSLNAGVVGSEDVSLIGGSASFADKHVGGAKTVSFTGGTLSGADAGNYVLDSVNATTSAITARPITVTAQTDTRVFNGTVSSSVSPSVPSLQIGDTVGTAPTQVFDTKNVGTGKTLTASGLVINDGNSGADYSVSYTADTTGVITASPITVTADNQTIEFGASDPTLTYATSTSSLFAGDSFTGTLVRAAGSGVTTYAITQGTLTAGTNYAITFVPGVFTIVDTTPPVITLSGATTTSVALNNTYVEPGFSALDAVDGSVTPVVTGSVDTSVAGTYILTYTATDAHSNATSTTRNVVVSGTGVSVTPVVSGGEASGTLTNATDVTQTGSLPFTLAMPANITVTGPAAWDGTIDLPEATTTFVAPTLPAGIDAAHMAAISVGSPTEHLTFNKGVRLIFPGREQYLVGWSDGTTFTPITTACTNDSQATGDALPAGGDCQITVGHDLVIWTKHFSTFISYDPTASATVSAGSGGGGNGAPVAAAGGGGGSVFVPAGPIAAPVIAAPAQAQGSVLGASTYHFSSDLKFGSRGGDVTELQKLLIAGGLLKAEATGYFGAQTKAAVIAYQKAYGITPTSGLVGPKTRAQLNLGVTTNTSNQESAIASLLAQVKALQAQLAALSATH